jgi:hypothetical protein
MISSDRQIEQKIEDTIEFLRGHKVILSSHLAQLYEVEHKALMQAVQRNKERFPEDFMFQLTQEEFMNLKSQSVTSSWGGIRKRPYAFTEQGVAMLSGILKSPRAIRVNIEIMRAFVRLRRILTAHQDLARKVAELETKYDDKFAIVFEAIRQLMTPPEPDKKKIGFRVEEPKGIYSPNRKHGKKGS